MLVDEVDIKLSGGHGGPGKVSFYPKEKAGPDGGNGGRGGDVYAQAIDDLFALNQFTRKKELSGGNGDSGDNFVKSGKNGDDLTISMPVGTVLIDKQTGEEIELNEVGQKVLICKGGKGGRGNFELRSSRNTTPKTAQKGLPGEVGRFKVHLKLIADFGLIGLPNAGKSSLLNELTAAHAKVGAYPFTTLEPNLGVMDRKILADIPGLIEGASEGRGLGIRFLKHIEKVGLLLHCISSESEDLKGDYESVRSELEKYDPQFVEKKEVILLTKTDLISKEDLKKKITQLKKLKKEIVPVSIHDWESLENLKKVLASFLPSR